jgi:hypothetical protein
MAESSRTERDPSRRCVSNIMTKVDHTHWCRLNHAHLLARTDHECICSITWAHATQEHE